MMTIPEFPARFLIMDSYTGNLCIDLIQVNIWHVITFLIKNSLLPVEIERLTLHVFRDVSGRVRFSHFVPQENFIVTRKLPSGTIARPLCFSVQFKKIVAFLVFLCNIFFLLVRLAITAVFQSLLPSSSISIPNPQGFIFHEKKHPLCICAYF